MIIEKTAAKKSLAVTLALALFASAPMSARSQTQAAASRAGTVIGLSGNIGSIGAMTPNMSTVMAPAALPNLSLNTAPVLQAMAAAPPVQTPAVQAKGIVTAQAMPDGTAKQSMITMAAAIDAANKAGTPGPEIGQAFDGGSGASASPEALAVETVKTIAPLPALAALPRPGKAVPSQSDKWKNFKGYYGDYPSQLEDAVRHARVELVVQTVEASRGRPVTLKNYRQMLKRLSNELPEDAWNDHELVPRGYAPRFLGLIKEMDNAKDLNQLFKLLDNDPINILTATEALLASQREKATLSRSGLTEVLQSILYKMFDEPQYKLVKFTSRKAFEDDVHLDDASRDYVNAHNSLSSREFEKGIQKELAKAEKGTVTDIYKLNRALYDLFRSDMVDLLSRNKDVLKNAQMEMADYSSLANRMKMSGPILYLRIKSGFLRAHGPLKPAA